MGGGSGHGGSAAAGGSGASGGTGGHEPTECVWPDAPYGVYPAELLSPQLSWQGFAAGSDGIGTVPITEFFDCDGSRGIHALFIDVVAITCGACQALASNMQPRMAAWEAAGIHAITIMGFAQATEENITAWRSTYGLEGSNVMLDAPESSVCGSSASSPLSLLVDPRTMQVEQRWSGLTEASPAEILGSVELLAAKNAPSRRMPSAHVPRTRVRRSRPAR